jgi:cob(I)alamin adenosyltransferase
MSERLNQITTRTGDDGSTGLADGRRVPKSDARIEALGAVDELNSFMGLLLAEDLPDNEIELLSDIQQHLFLLGGELAMPEWQGLNEAHLQRLDTAIAHTNAKLPPLQEFILPRGDRATALAHVCRSICRRAERRVVALAEQELISTLLQRYLNRLSDLLFVLARHLGRLAEIEEILWEREENA